MIGYDFDGVFVPDCLHFDDIKTTAEFYESIVFKMKPIFFPRDSYVVITSRNKEHEKFTKRWFKHHLPNNMPLFLYHSNDYENNYEYKAFILKNSGYVTTYVESDPQVFEYLQKNCKQQILLFSDVINQITKS